jgi:hypothetical protein
MVNCDSPKEGVGRMSSNSLGRKVFSVVRQLEWLMEEPNSPLKCAVSGNASACVPYCVSDAANDLSNLQDEIEGLIDMYINCEVPSVPMAIKTLENFLEKFSGIQVDLEKLSAKASPSNEKLQFEVDADFDEVDSKSLALLSLSGSTTIGAKVDDDVSSSVSSVAFGGYSISGAANDLLNLQDEIGMLVDDWLNCADPNAPAAIRTVSVVIEKLSGIKSGLEMLLARVSSGNTKEEERLQFEEDTDL